MWKILGLALAVIASAASAQDRYILNQNQTGLALPGVSLPTGYDEVRTTEGSSCRSSNGNDGAYADIGVIGGNDVDGQMNAGAVYGRVVIPLGKKAKRLNCQRLYDLEIERLQMEVRLLKAGMNSGASMASAEAAPPDLEDGWTEKGLKEVPVRNNPAMGELRGFQP